MYAGILGAAAPPDFHFAPATAAQRPATIRSILLFAHPAGVRGAAARRAWLLADALGARLRTVHVWDPRDAESVRRALLPHLEVDLVVVGTWNGLTSATAGDMAAVVLRHASCPVLVVQRRGAPRYAKILATVRGQERCRELLRLAALVDAQAEIEVFHAATRQDDGFAHRARWMDGCRQLLPQRRLSFSDSFGTRRNRVLAEIGCGDVGLQAAIQQQRSGADLLVVREEPSRWRLRPRRSVVERALAAAECDVLALA
jgi:nucleotide-binding universal stress UspA family protein